MRREGTRRRQLRSRGSGEGIRCSFCMPLINQVLIDFKRRVEFTQGRSGAREKNPTVALLIKIKKRSATSERLAFRLAQDHVRRRCLSHFFLRLSTFDHGSCELEKRRAEHTKDKIMRRSTPFGGIFL